LVAEILRQCSAVIFVNKMLMGWFLIIFGVPCLIIILKLIPKFKAAICISWWVVAAADRRMDRLTDSAPHTQCSVIMQMDLSINVCYKYFYVGLKWTVLAVSLFPHVRSLNCLILLKNVKGLYCTLWQ
jgi:hypothetical protein